MRVSSSDTNTSNAHLDFRDHNIARQTPADYDILREAAILLRSDLVWSADFELIRCDLAEALDYYAISQQYGYPALLNIAKKLLKETHA